MVTVDRIQKKELKELSLLYNQLGSSNLYIEKLNREFDKIASNNNYFLLGIKENNRLIGSALTIICLDLFNDCRPFMIVENVVIDKENRHKGYGTILFNKIENIAKRYNCYFIMLLSNKKRTKSHKFYKKIGYDNNSLGFKKYLS
ncbi:GNAT family N-acetyltransferase [Dethiothermospora halolimnae]|uniref:GNAT family N-acetyltransferase n=1 Tax=Dethiothermospora halolimnae TaxID=3114390 RepID=UPI003CCB85D6